MTNEPRTMNLRRVTIRPVCDEDGRAGLTLVYWPKGIGHQSGGVYAVVSLDWEALATLDAKRAAKLLASALENGLHTLIQLYDDPDDAQRLGIFEGSSDVDATIARIRALHDEESP